MTPLFAFVHFSRKYPRETYFTYIDEKPPGIVLPGA